MPINKFMKSESFDSLIKELEPHYEPAGVIRSLLRSDTTAALSPNTIPSIDRVVFSADESILQTDKGPLIDLSSQTVNTILGQNDIWVTANQIAFQKSGFPSFLTSRLRNVYASEVSSFISQIGGIPDPIVNLRICTGASAIESLLSAAWQYRIRTTPDRTTKSKVGTFLGGFHGQTGNAGMISSVQKDVDLPFRFPGQTFDQCIFIGTPTNSTFDDDTLSLSENDCRILETVVAHRKELFLILIEPILMNYGVITPSPQFLVELKRVCSENNILLGYDEVQTGCGWLGSMSAAERTGVIPNLLALSKALTAGYGPLGAVVSERGISQPLGTGESTNGADVRSLIAARAVYERLNGIPLHRIPNSLPEGLKQELSQGLLPTIQTKAQKLRSLLESLTERYAGILGPLRGDRLIIGIPILDSKKMKGKEIANVLQQAFVEKGVFVRVAHQTIIIKPAATISDATMTKAVEIMDSALNRLYEKFL
jgi:4-aminobutyrate aminotransferase-like enzyme